MNSAYDDKSVSLNDEGNSLAITTQSGSEISSRNYEDNSVADTDIEKDPIQRETTHLLLKEIDDNRGKTFFQRNFSSMTKGGIRSSVFTLFSGTVGGGVLSLPHVRISLI